MVEPLRIQIVDGCHRPVPILFGNTPHDAAYQNCHVQYCSDSDGHEVRGAESMAFQSDGIDLPARAPTFQIRLHRGGSSQRLSIAPVGIIGTWKFFA
jgi:hypothetical protein